MDRLIILLFFIVTSVTSCESLTSTVCDSSGAVPLEVTRAGADSQFHLAKWILYKVNIALGSGVQAGMPGSNSFAKETKSLAELDLIFDSYSVLGDTTIFTFEFEGGVYPSDHPYYNTIKFYEKNQEVEISESERFSWLISRGAYESNFNLFLDTTSYSLATFLRCYSPND